MLAAVITVIVAVFIIVIVQFIWACATQFAARFAQLTVNVLIAIVDAVAVVNAATVVIVVVVEIAVII